MNDKTVIEQLWIEFKRDTTNISLRNQLVNIYYSIVNHQARKLLLTLPQVVDIDDLISAGTLGLIEAIERFDLLRNFKFETYCVQRIRGAMLDELRKMDWVPRLIRLRANKINAAAKDFDLRHGRMPDENELAEEMQITVADLEKLIAETTPINTVSLSKKWYETDSFKDMREIDILENKRAEDPTQQQSKMDLLRLVTKGLSRNERMIIILYYYENATMKKIGQAIGLSESRVSQMHSKLLLRLKERLDGRQDEFMSIQTS